MSRKLLISWLPGETRAALVIDDRLEELLVLRDDQPRLFGNLYRGRVAGFDRELEAAFIELGTSRPGFLPLSGTADRQPREGDLVTVRVVREPRDGKGPRLSLEKEQSTGASPALVSQGADPVVELALRMPQPDVLEVDDASVLTRLKPALPSELSSRLLLRSVPDGLFRSEGLDAEIDELLEPEVALAGGGSLLIEPVRSLTAIDVNSGQRSARGGWQQLALATNLAAADEAARQLRLRALSGLIVADFLELRDPQARRQVVERLRQGLKGARVRPMAASGLVELTLQRKAPSLQETLTEPCGLGGSGRRKSPVTLGYEALRAVLREAARNPGVELSLRTSAQVGRALTGAVGEARCFVEARLGRTLAVGKQSSADSPDFEVVARAR